VAVLGACLVCPAIKDRADKGTGRDCTCLLITTNDLTTDNISIEQDMSGSSLTDTNDIAIAGRIKALKKRISAIEKEYVRVPGSVQLLAVSKTQPLSSIKAALASGQRHFGENYLQEALDKMTGLADKGIVWHFIGPIQSNKTRPLAAHFDWIHTVDREKIAHRLNEQRPGNMAPLNILLQVNTSGEDSKSGIAPEGVQKLAETVASLPRLRLSGLMSIPASTDDFDAQRAAFHALREARDQLLQAGFASCTELSMGMSNDFKAAIAEGATMIRIGTDIFGPR
jgi:pyridoxal phosphate enzyme (YggS family)